MGRRPVSTTLRRTAADGLPAEPPRPPEAKAIALRLLALRPHATAELRRKLLQRRCPAGEIEETLGRLGELGYLDDLAFARALVARRSTSRGPALIAQELAAKGISRTLAQEALSDLDRSDQVASASLVGGSGMARDPRRTAARLQRRGFSREVIREALNGQLDEL
jgi:regulatory protein